MNVTVLATSFTDSKWWKVLNSDIVLLLAAFLLTTLIGAWLTTRSQRAAWRRQTRVELLRERYAEGTRLLETLSHLIGRRFFAARRYLWAIENPKSYDLPKVSEDYYATVAEWNARMWDIRNKIRLLLSERHAAKFLDYKDDRRGNAPESLHYKFVRLGRILRQARDAKTTTQAAQKEVHAVNWACSNMLEALTTDFVTRAAALELLDVGEEQRPIRREFTHATNV